MPEKLEIYDEGIRVNLYKEDLRTFVQVTFALLTHGRYLTVTAKWVYVALRSFTNQKTGATFPSYKKLMERSGLSRSSVTKGLNELEFFGWIKKLKQNGSSTRYTFHYPLKYDGVDYVSTPCPSQSEAKRYAEAIRRDSNNAEISCSVNRC